MSTTRNVRPTPIWWSSLGRWPLIWRLALTGLLIALEGLVAGGLGWLVTGSKGLSTGWVAAGCCGLGSSLALLVGERFRQPDQVWQQLGAGVLFRMGLPLGAGLVVLKGFPGWAGSAFGIQLIGCYLVTLLWDTVLIVASLQAAAAVQRKS